ncbi:MAG: hypothetical protein IJ930_02865, partial [Lachnospiraceae bacterium]|nr:hypothetical protein [Lachnospiraceae bacterium]
PTARSKAGSNAPGKPVPARRHEVKQDQMRRESLYRPAGTQQNRITAYSVEQEAGGAGIYPSRQNFVILLKCITRKDQPV